MQTQQEEIEQFRELGISASIEIRKKGQGFFSPLFYVLSSSIEEEGSRQVKTILLPGELMETSNSKEFLSDVLIPSIIKSLKAEKKKLICACLAVDSFVRSATFKGEEIEKVRKMSQSELVELSKSISSKNDALIFFFNTYSYSETCHIIYKKDNGKIVFDEPVKDSGEAVHSRFGNPLKPDPSDN